MQKPSDIPAVTADARTYDRLFRISLLCAPCWGVSREDIEIFPTAGERQRLARMAAITIAWELLATSPERLTLHYGGDVVEVAAAHKQIKERIERDYEFRITMRFLKSACATILGAA